MEVQRLAPEEGERYRAIRLRSLREAPDAFSSTFEAASARPGEDWGKQVTELATFVAVEDGQDVGTARGVQYESENAAILLSMWVAPRYRGKGVGEALVDAVVGWARAEGFARVLLDVADHNERAIALYARMGFEPTGERGSLPAPREDVGEHRRARVISP